MHRPLRIPLHLRVWQWLKNLLLLNRNDWNKASDGLNMPTLTHEERERARPKPEQDLIRPREKPRARLDSFRGAEISRPEYQPQIISEPVVIRSAELADGLEEAGGDEANAEGAQYVLRKKRRYRRRSTSQGSQGNGFFRRVFGKKGPS